jgi:hypothetical protein
LCLSGAGGVRDIAVLQVGWILINCLDFKLLIDSTQGLDFTCHCLVFKKVPSRFQLKTPAGTACCSRNTQ